MRKAEEITYTLEEIMTAWLKFTQPSYLVDKGKQKEIDLNNVQQGQVIEYENNVRILPIDYSRWIPYLLSNEWKEDQS